VAVHAEAARAYHMRVVDDVIDERLSPPKSTEAGISFLSDLKSKLGSWDLAFAAYNCGPFGVLGRIARAGGDVGFWDLVDAEMLPEETANYVPTIEAFASSSRTCSVSSLPAPRCDRPSSPGI